MRQGCKTFRFRAPVILKDYTGVYEETSYNGFVAYQLQGKERYVYRSTNGKWLFSKKFGSSIGDIVTDQTTLCPATETSMWKYTDGSDKRKELTVIQNVKRFERKDVQIGNPFFTTYCQYVKVSNTELWGTHDYDGVYKRDIGKFVNGLPTWTYKKNRIERVLGGGWKLYYEENLHSRKTGQRSGGQTFWSNDNIFCPGEANWYHDSKPTETCPNLMRADDIPINCVRIYTNQVEQSEGFARWFIHLSNGMVHEREDRGALKQSFDKTYCFSSEVSYVKITSGKKNGWVGHVEVSDIDGETKPFLCTDGCARATGTISETGIAVSGGYAVGTGIEDLRKLLQNHYYVRIYHTHIA